MSLLNQLKNFNKSGLKATKTIVKTQDGKEYVETREGGSFNKSEKMEDSKFYGWVIDDKPDMQLAKIEHNLYFGAQDVISEMSILKEYNIKHILTLVPDIRPLFPNEFEYKVLPILDIPEFVFMSHFDEIYEFIESCLKRNEALYVHCNAGLSRAPTAIASYLIKKYQMTVDDAISRIQEVRPHARPNKGFIKQLNLYVEKYKLNKCLV